ncbi:hypothetical protein [Pseudomonas tohonis]|uniref:hypothetical protein n=1 Tax=Pseudomonas tohonis TaxID=2725477 RepID=UPI0021D9DFEA|nr:hypothetical protein [Pseudomonas tohonis]UXY52244.1 hypothetical protein N9L84_25340 [Pseudomonas tohonis]
MFIVFLAFLGLGFLFTALYVFYLSALIDIKKEGLAPADFHYKALFEMLGNTVFFIEFFRKRNWGDGRFNSAYKRARYAFLLSMLFMGLAFFVAEKLSVQS